MKNKMNNPFIAAVNTPNVTISKSLFFLLLLICTHSAFAQINKNTPVLNTTPVEEQLTGNGNSAPITSTPEPSTIVFPPMPLMNNTGNAAQDAANYAAAKEKWANAWIALIEKHKGPIDTYKKNKLREALKNIDLNGPLDGDLIFTFMDNPYNNQPLNQNK